MDQNTGEVATVRLFVGGISPEVSSGDLKERFSTLGTVLNVTSPPAKYGSGPHRGFAYVDFLPKSKACLGKLFSAYKGCKWRGEVLRIEVASEHYIDKLQTEWAAEAEALAAAEAELLRKKNDVPAVPATKQAKSWPLLLLEQPEKPDKWKKKRDFERGAADGDGIKIFFPRLKKMKTVPSKGLGKHKKSFQRVESLPLKQLSTCDCDESLRTGSCDCSTIQPVAGDDRDGMVTNAEDDTISLAIAKERQRQLHLLNKLFPSDSPSNGAEIKNALSHIDNGARTDLRKNATASETASSRSRNGDDSREVAVPTIKEKSSRAASEVVKRKGIEREKVSPAAHKEEKGPEVQPDEPEMWVSFMDTMALPAKTEENISEFDLDELSLMLSEEEEESEEEEAAEAIPDAPKKKAKRKKKKGKKSKQVPQNVPGNEQGIVSSSARESDSQPKTNVGSPLSSRDEVDVSLSKSEELPTSYGEELSRVEKETHVQADERKKRKRVSVSYSHVDIENLHSEEQKAMVNVMDSEPSEDETESSHDEIEHTPPFLDDKDEFFAGVSSSDESSDSEADEGEMWVSGLDVIETAPLDKYPLDASSKDPRSESKGIGPKSMSRSIVDVEDKKDFGQHSLYASKAEKEPSKDDLTSKDAADIPPSNNEESDEEGSLKVVASDDDMEPEGDEPEVWVNSMEPMEDGHSSEELHSDDEDHSQIWVSGLESTTTVPLDLKKVLKTDSGKVLSSTDEGYEDPSRTPALASILLHNVGEATMDKTKKVEPKKGNSSEPTIATLFSKPDEEVWEVPEANEGLAPKRKELTRATWRSLVGESGRVVFSLQQLLGKTFPPETLGTDKVPAGDDTHLEEKAAESDVSQEKDVQSITASITQPDWEKLRTKSTPKAGLKRRKEVLEVDAPPLIPVFTNCTICPFMKSADAEKEWLATKLDLRSDYRSKHKQAVKKSRKLRGR